MSASGLCAGFWLKTGGLKSKKRRVKGKEIDRMAMDRRPRQGEIYRHFKNKLYQITGIARHSETGEELVIYQALYGDFGLYARPLDMFISPVDREKYPDVPQEYRFERVDRRELLRGEASRPDGRGQEAEAGERPVNPDLMEFLEAGDLAGRLAALRKLEKSAGQGDIDCLAAVLETDPGTGSIREQLENIRKFLGIHGKYDGSRLRADRD